MDLLGKQAKEELVRTASLEEYFHDSVDAALSSNKVVLDDHTAHYVVNLLVLFARSDALYETTTDGYRLKPLALMLADAVQASNEFERNNTLQRLGDVSLFIAGFFAEGLRRAAVDMDYYVYMGGGAYHSLSVHMRGTPRGGAFVDIFSELGEKFQDMVDVLNEVRDAARGNSDEDVLRLYELWVKTGSRRVRRKLRDMGVEPIRQGAAAFEH
jgi:hypothetical protein